MLELVRPRADMYAAWTEAHREWGPGLHEDGFGIDATDDVDTEPGFRAWVDALGRDPGGLWWIVDDGVVLGGVALRAADDERVGDLGHIGYGVRPSARGRGVATWAIGQVLAHAERSGLDPVLAVCLDDNAASIASIERIGGTLQRTDAHGSAMVRVYAIPTTGRAG